MMAFQTCEWRKSGITARMTAPNGSVVFRMIRRHASTFENRWSDWNQNCKTHQLDAMAQDPELGRSPNALPKVTVDKSGLAAGKKGEREWRARA